MNVLAVLQGVVIGALLGFLFFAGLWLTIQKGLLSTHPGIWFALSLVLRLGVVVLGFVWVARQGWQQLIAALAGFLVIRSVTSGRARQQISQIRQGKEGSGDEHQS
ncbi:MAG: hypothetical protein EOM08_00020 [Clostridia bacterium]|nr:hypothetical protein [Clostridia bacterium]NCC74809.1 hypothetical protein [Clostridia bacterium]